MIISLVIPVYNVEEYIEKCLSSCIAQDIPDDDYEILVINDGSPDNSVVIAERLAKTHCNIRIINQENRGLSGARNTGIKHAQGEYIWFIDSDDWIRENCLYNITTLLSREAPDCLALGAANVLDINVFKRRNIHLKAKSGIELLKIGVEICVPFAIWNRNYLLDHDLYFHEGILHEDIEFSPRAYYLAKKVSYLDDIIYYVYCNPNSITRTPNPKRSYDLISVINLQLSKFMQNVDKEHLGIYHNRIALNINNALNYMMPNSKENKVKLNRIMFEHRHMFKHMLKSSHLKYKIEGLLFYLFPKHTFQVYMLCQSFNKK